jgi:hypothetical protein
VHTFNVRWNEELALKEGLVRFQVRRISVRADRWSVTGAVVNRSPYAASAGSAPTASGSKARV